MAQHEPPKRVRGPEAARTDRELTRGRRRHGRSAAALTAVARGPRRRRCRARPTYPTRSSSRRAVAGSPRPSGRPACAPARARVRDTIAAPAGASTSSGFAGAAPGSRAVASACAATAGAGGAGSRSAVDPDDGPDRRGARAARRPRASDPRLGRRGRRSPVPAAPPGACATCGCASSTPKGTATALAAAHAARHATRSGERGRTLVGATRCRRRPPIVTREQWGADKCPPRAAPVYGQVKIAFVHHTVTANDYGPQDSAAIVLGICRYHRNSNGWNDIGYNFLVDRYGTIFEGRAGGIDQAVVGAQAQGYNAESTGDREPRHLQHQPARRRPGSTRSPGCSAGSSPCTACRRRAPSRSTPAGGSTNRYPAGAQVTLRAHLRPPRRRRDRLPGRRPLRPAPADCAQMVDPGLPRAAIARRLAARRAPSITYGAKADADAAPSPGRRRRRCRRQPVDVQMLGAHTALDARSTRFKTDFAGTPDATCGSPTTAACARASRASPGPCSLQSSRSTIGVRPAGQRARSASRAVGSAGDRIARPGPGAGPPSARRSCWSSGAAGGTYRACRAPERCGARGRPRTSFRFARRALPAPPRGPARHAEPGGALERDRAAPSATIRQALK